MPRRSTTPKPTPKPGPPGPPPSTSFSPATPRPRITRKTSLHPEKPATPLAALLYPVRAATSQWIVLPVLLLVAFLFRWAVALGPYSGQAAPPMHGDFEAQRHWMEITTALPVREWYWHEPEWWGLDYPPLTAYHSWVLGKIGALIEPEWFALHDSRGLDVSGLKTFMRATVAASEYAVYIPAVVIFVRVYGGQAVTSKYERAVALASILMHPGLLLIDHGHFQYNSVMFGLSILALDCFLTDHLVWGSFFFVLSLCFKQMALYYAPAVFAYLLGLCVFPRINLPRLLAIGATTLATFALMLLPLYLAGGVEQITQCAIRVFPFARGLWEDKVANFWCTANVVIKFRETYTSTQLQRASLIATLAAITPPCVLLFLHPSKRLLPLALSACAWGFFLFSFQVHEKSVLIPLLPATLYLAGTPSSSSSTSTSSSTTSSSTSSYPSSSSSSSFFSALSSSFFSPTSSTSWIAWMNTIGVFTLSPLLRRDGLLLQYCVITLLHIWLHSRLPDGSWIARTIQIASYLAVVAVHAAELIVGKVERWPDLWVVANVAVGFGGFCVAWAWTLGMLWVESGVVRDKGKGKGKGKGNVGKGKRE